MKFWDRQETHVQVFYDNLNTIRNKYQLEPDKRFHIHETGKTMAKKSEILALKGQKQVGKVTSGPMESIIIVVCQFNPAGQYVPSLFIFKRKLMSAQLLKDSHANMIATVSIKLRMSQWKSI